MGSWNETCGLTNLPITAGEEVYLTVIEPNPSDRRPFFYAFDLYYPTTPMFKGKYDDYGGVDMSEENEVELLRWLPDSEPADDHRDGNMTVNGHYYTMPNRQFPLMIRKDAYEMLLGLVLRDEETFTVEHLERDSREKFSDKIAAARRQWGKLGRKYLATFVGYDLKRSFDGREASTPPVYSKGFKLLDAALATGGKEYQLIGECEKAVEPLWAIGNLYIGLDLLRKMLMPTGGAGSQSWNERAYTHFGEFVRSKAQERLRSWNDSEDV